MPGGTSFFATSFGDSGDVNNTLALYSGGPSFGSLVEVASADDCNNVGFINTAVLPAGTYYLQVGESADVFETAATFFYNGT
jgi:hypothetical protein